MRERLYRSRTDRVLFGVAGGFADWLDLDPALVRIVWALLVLAGGAGFLLYIVAAIVIPEEPWEVASAPMAPPAPLAPMPAADAGAMTPAAGAPATDGSASLGSAPIGAAPLAAPASMTREQARQARRAARQAARGERDGTGILIFGLILVVLGGWFLVRDVFPGLDDRFFGPGLLVLIGILLVAGAILRQGGERRL